MCLAPLATGMDCLTRVLSDRQAGFRRISQQQGFGDFKNKYSWAIAEFGGDIYVGTLNADGRPFCPWNMPDPRADVLEIWRQTEKLAKTDGGEIWRYAPAEGDWVQALDMEDIDPKTVGFRKLIVYQEALFAGTLNISGPAQIWTSPDGGDWSVSLQLSGANQCVRGMAVVGDYLYAGTDNREEMAELWRFDGTTWELVTVFEEVAMLGELTQMDGLLYIATWDRAGGFEVYRYDGREFELVVRQTEEPDDMAVMSMHPFKGKLYIGTANFGFGFALYAYDPTSGQLELIEPRGFGVRSNAYAWRLEEHRGRLYLGTWNTGVHDGGKWFDRGLQLWSSEDGSNWELEIADGIGNFKNFGVRALLSTGDCLYLGTANNIFTGFGTEIWVREEEME